MITAHFGFTEFIRTDVPNGVRYNIPTGEVCANLGILALVLEDLRVYMGEPVIISSGYRSEYINRKVGGVKNSWHMKGLAADLHVRDEKHAARMFGFLKEHRLTDSVLFEHGRSGSRWIHIQVSPINPRHRSNWNYIAE